MKIYLDFDGVVVDFVKGAYLAHNRKHSEEIVNNEVKHFDWWIDQWNISNKQFWSKIDNLGSKFWSNLEPYQWFDELINLCENFSIATSPSHHSSATSGKIDSIQKLLGNKFRAYHITPEKWDLGAPGRILIDDLEDNCIKFEENGGFSILMPQPWNKNNHLLDDRMEYVKEQLTLLKETCEY